MPRPRYSPFHGLDLAAARPPLFESIAKLDRRALDDHPSCPRTSPGQLPVAEVGTVKTMALATEHRHMPLRTLALYAQRVGRVIASVTTWAKLVREHGWRRLRHRRHPPKPTVGVHATQPNEASHVDTTVIRLLDGTRVSSGCSLKSMSPSRARCLRHSGVRSSTSGRDVLWHGRQPAEGARGGRATRESRASGDEPWLVVRLLQSEQVVGPGSETPP